MTYLIHLERYPESRILKGKKMRQHELCKKKQNFSSCKKAITKLPLNMKRIGEPQKVVFGQKQFLKIDSTWWGKKEDILLLDKRLYNFLKNNKKDIKTL